MIASHIKSIRMGCAEFSTAHTRVMKDVSSEWWLGNLYYHCSRNQGCYDDTIGDDNFHCAIIINYMPLFFSDTFRGVQESQPSNFPFATFAYVSYQE